MKSKQEALARAMADLATESILFEVILTPKPGLVDAKDPGSHREMDIFTFVRSAVSLSHGFREFFLAGFTGEEDLPALFAQIRPLGMEVEEKMFDATGKVNTHKGIIFSMGIILAALGRYARTREGEGPYTPEETEAVLQLVTQMTQGLVSKDFQSLAHRPQATHGERLYVAIEETEYRQINGLDFTIADKGKYLGKAKYNESAVRLYSVKGDTEDKYIYAFWDWEGFFYVLNE